jgi:hypothetical protein
MLTTKIKNNREAGVNKMRFTGRMPLNKFILSTYCLFPVSRLLRLRNPLIPKLESATSSRSLYIFPDYMMSHSRVYYSL